MQTALREHGHVIADGLIAPRMADVLYRMLLLRQWRGEFRRDDQVPAAASHWGDSTLDALLLGLQPEIERVSGCALLPTYAYARLYLHGQSLARHRDRDACEIAVTLHLGDRVDHWREAFHGDHFGQLFLNYVRADGDRCDRLYDGRHHAFPPDALSCAAADRIDTAATV